MLDTPQEDRASAEARGGRVRRVAVTEIPLRRDSSYADETATTSIQRASASGNRDSREFA